MFYRLTLTANFSTPPPPGYLHTIRDYVQSHAITINPDTSNQEPSDYVVHRCFHDENPTAPCEVIDEWSSYP